MKRTVMKDERWVLGKSSGENSSPETERNGLINNCRNRKSKMSQPLTVDWTIFFGLQFYVTHSPFSTPSCPLLAVIIALNHTCWWHTQPWQLGRFSFCEIILQTFSCLSKEPQQESGIIWLGVKHPGPEPGSFGWTRLQNLEKKC